MNNGYTIDKEETRSLIEGRNAVREAFRAGETVDRLYVQDGLKDGPVMDLIRRAKKADAVVDYVSKERLDKMSETGRHQGVIAHAAAYSYAQVEDILKKAADKGEAPFILPGRRARTRLSLFWMRLRIRITWERSSEPRTCAARMG